MMWFIACCTVLLLVHNSVQIPKIENCDKSPLGKESAKDCFQVKCFGGETAVEIRTCDIVVCREGTQIGYHKGDDEKEYPECCSYEICEE